jgi:ribosomal protein L40E
LSEEQTVAKIASKLNCTSAEVEKRVADKVRKFEGFLTKEAALNLVASEAGVEPEKARNYALGEIRRLNELKAGESAGVEVVVAHVFAPKRFEKNGRRGKVCNITIRDSTGEATLVLWGHDTRIAEEVERGDVLEVRNASVKASRMQQSQVELHASLLTQVKVRKAREAGALKAKHALPPVPAGVVKLSELNEGSGEVDCFARVLEVGEEREFKRDAGVKSVARCVVSDGSAQVPLVLWDGSSEAVRRLKVGDAIKIEGGYAKKNAATGGLELNVGWRGHVALNPENHGLQDAEKLLEASAPKKNLAELAEGELATVEGRISRVYGGKAFLVCRACGTRNTRSNVAVDACECGSKDLRMQAMIACEVQDATKALRLVLWGREALRLLGLSAAPTGGATLEAFDTAFEMKRDSLVGRKVKATVRAKRSSFTNEIEGVVRNVLYVGEAEAAAAGAHAAAEPEVGEFGKEVETMDYEEIPSGPGKSMTQSTLDGE